MSQPAKMPNLKGSPFDERAIGSSMAHLNTTVSPAVFLVRVVSVLFSLSFHRSSEARSRCRRSSRPWKKRAFAFAFDVWDINRTSYERNKDHRYERSKDATSGSWPYYW